MAKDAKTKSARKDFRLAENIAKWLIIIVLTGAALTLVFLVAIGVVIAVVIRPKAMLLAERLRKNKKAMNGTAKERCMAFYSEVSEMINPGGPSNAASACTTTQQIQSGDKLFAAMVTADGSTSTDPAHMAHLSSATQARIREHAIKSNTKIAANLKGKHAPEPEPHTPSHPAGSDTNPAYLAAAADGLGIHE